MPENNQILSVEGQLVGMPLAGPESFSAEQLAYLKRALGVDETVLWEGTPASVTSVIPLSETVANFEQLSIYAEWTFNTDTKVPVYVVIPSTIGKFSLNGASPSITTRQASIMQVYSVGGVYSASGTSITPINVFRYQITDGNGTCTVGNFSTSDTLKIFKVVGIHRISGGN